MSADKKLQFIHRNTIVEYLNFEYNTINSDEFEMLVSIFEDADKEDIDGIRLKEPDEMLNENEQKNFLKQIKEKLPSLYDKLNKFFTLMKNKTDNEILADNIGLLSDWDAKPTQANLHATLEKLNCGNVIDVVKLFNNKHLMHMFYDILDDAEHFKADKDTIQKIMDKYKILSEHIIKTAKEKNIYIADYEKELQEYSEKRDYKNYAIIMDRIFSRYMIETDTDKLINASKRRLELKEPNGTIDENFVQGYMCNCWFISAIVAISTKPALRQRLNDMITVNKDGNKIISVTVNIQGKNYEIEYETLKNANDYSSGDLDVRALEIAVNQYMHENDLGDIGFGNGSFTAYRCLFGEKNVRLSNQPYFDETHTNLKIKEYSDAVNNDKNFVSTVSHGLDEQGFLVTNDKGEDVLLHDSHAYAVTRVDLEYVYFKDPHNMAQELKMPIKDFEEYFDRIYVCKYADNNEL